MVRVVAAAGALGVAGALAGQIAAHADTAGPVAGAASARASAVDERHLGPVSTAAIGGVLAAGALWARRRRSDVTT